MKKGFSFLLFLSLFSLQGFAAPTDNIPGPIPSPLPDNHPSKEIVFSTSMFKEEDYGVSVIFSKEKSCQKLPLDFIFSGGDSSGKELDIYMNSQFIMIDQGQRYARAIGIVTVTYLEFKNSTQENIYEFQVEILGNNGIAGKMTTTVDNVDKMRASTLSTSWIVADHVPVLLKWRADLTVSGGCRAPGKRLENLNEEAQEKPNWVVEKGYLSK